MSLTKIKVTIIKILKNICLFFLKKGHLQQIMQKVFFIVYVNLGRRPSFRSEKFEFCYVPHMLDVTSKMAFQKGVFYYWHDFPSNQRVWVSWMDFKTNKVPNKT